MSFPKRNAPLVREQIAIAALRHGIHPEMVFWKTNQPHIVAARVDVMRSLRARDWSLTRIGKALGGMHHTTVLSHLQKPMPQPEKPADFSFDGPDFSGEWAI